MGRPLRTLTGRLDELLQSPEFGDAAEARIRVRLTDGELPLQAMARLQQRFPHAVVLEHTPEGHLAPGGTDVADAVASAETASELTLRFWSDQHGRDVTQPEREVLASAVAAAAVSEERP